MSKSKICCVSQNQGKSGTFQNVFNKLEAYDNFESFCYLSFRNLLKHNMNNNWFLRKGNYVIMNGGKNKMVFTPTVKPEIVDTFLPTV